MKTISLLSALLLILLFLNCGCNDNSTNNPDNLTVKPIVKKTSINYTRETISSAVPDTAFYNKICKAYTNHYSDDIKKAMINNMENQAGSLGENVNVFDSVLTHAGFTGTAGYLLPIYAERAQYNNKEVWIVESILGLGKPVFSGFKFLVIGITKYDTLYAVYTK
jgi:hypothetical protein